MLSHGTNQNQAPFDPQFAEETQRADFGTDPSAVVPPTGFTGGGRGGNGGGIRRGGNGGSGNGGGSDACDLVSVNLSAYQDGELDPDQMRLVVNHLTTCPQCAAELKALRATDRRIQREWRDSAPLPSSSRFDQSIDAIMAALPPAPAAPAVFAPKRVHARARWMRFSTGMAGIIALAGMSWSSYQLGYVHGRRSTRPASPIAISPLSASPFSAATATGASSFLRVSPASYTPALPRTTAARALPPPSDPPELP